MAAVTDHITAKNELIAACCMLFGPIYHFSHENMSKISLEELKDSFRDKAKLYHPDRAKLHGKSEIDLTNRFKELNNAYSMLVKYLSSAAINRKFSYTGSGFGYKYRNSDKSSGSAHAHAHPSGNSFHNSSKTYCKNDFFYTGGMPSRKLRLGEYLYYAKKISWNILINAIVSQYRKRPKFGDICIDLNYLDHNETLYIIKNLKNLEKFGEAALRLNLLSNHQLYAVLGTQKKYNMPIGKFFTDNNIIDHESLNAFILKQTEHNFKVKFHSDYVN